jgi:hypothetical protein
MTEHNDQRPSLSEQVAQSRRRINVYLGVAAVELLVTVVEAPYMHPGMGLNSTSESFMGAAIVGLGAAGLAYRELLKQSKLGEQDTRSEQPTE